MRNFPAKYKEFIHHDPLEDPEGRDGQQIIAHVDIIRIQSDKYLQISYNTQNILNCSPIEAIFVAGNMV